MPTLKQRLAAGETLIGPFVALNDPDLVEIIGRAGWDFVVLDCEHGPFGSESAANLIRSCEATRMHPVIRAPFNEDWLINKALDVGAEAVLVPQVDSIQAAEKAISAAKYAPRGHRGANPFTKAGGFAARGGARYYDLANEETMVMLQVEGIGGVEAFPEMLELEDADAFFIGPVDLSHSLGLPGQIDHPKVIAKITELLAVARDHAKPMGIFANDVETARTWKQLGAQFIGYSLDTAIIHGVFSRLASDLRARL